MDYSRENKVTTGTIGGGPATQRPLSDTPPAPASPRGHSIDFKPLESKEEVMIPFALLAVAGGIRLHCAVGIGADLGNSRAGWLESNPGPCGC